jgi:integrase
MSSLFKPTIVRYETRKGRRCQKNTPGAVACKCEAQKWYGQYRNAAGKVVRVPLDISKEKAQRKLAKLLEEAEQIRDGKVDPFKEHRKAGLAGHVEAFRRHLEAKGNCYDHVELTIARVQAIIDGCGFDRIGDLGPGRIMEWLADLRRTGRKLPNRITTVPASIRTSNGYLIAVKSFSRWLVKDRRAAEDALAHLSRLNDQTDIRRRRRALHVREVGWLLETTKASPDEFRGLTGLDRFMLYSVAMQTGFRAAELASLTPDSFDLDGDPPTVTVEAAYSKRRRRDVQPLPLELLDSFRAYLEGKAGDMRLWPGSWVDRAAPMLRLDLAATSAAMRKADPESEGIPYATEDGVVDFHALRHSYITLLVASGVRPKTCQTLARHSTITLTMDRYAHVGLSDQATALEDFPSLLPSAAPRLAKTGTENGCTNGCTTPGVFESQSVPTSPVNQARQRMQKPRGNRGFRGKK